MKSLLVAILVLTASASVSMAREFDDDGGPGVPAVKYFSWCEGNNVIEPINNGHAQMKFQCALSGLKCVQKEKIAGTIRVVYAVCQ